MRRAVSILLGAAVLALTASAAGATALSRPDSAPTRIPVLGYHGITTDQTVVHGSADPRFFDVRLSEFEAQLKHLREAGYRSITPEQYAKWAHHEPVSLPEKPVLITFDDGQASAQLADAVLKANGFRATMYVASGLAGEFFGGPNGERGWYMSWAQLRELRATGRWDVQFHAGPNGHAYFQFARFPDCHHDYTCRFGQSEDKYRRRVQSDVSKGLGAMRAVFRLPAGWRSATFAAPWGGTADAEPWLAPYFASQFPVVFVEDGYRGNVDNQRYRLEVHNPVDLAQFEAALGSPRFER